jgi:hypothetical protein
MSNSLVTSRIENYFQILAGIENLETVVYGKAIDEGYGSYPSFGSCQQIQNGVSIETRMNRYLGGNDIKLSKKTGKLTPTGDIERFGMSIFLKDESQNSLASASTSVHSGWYKKEAMLHLEARINRVLSAQKALRAFMSDYHFQIKQGVKSKIPVASKTYHLSIPQEIPDMKFSLTYQYEVDDGSVLAVPNIFLRAEESGWQSSVGVESTDKTFDSAKEPLSLLIERFEKLTGTEDFSPE